jgi:transcriptional regulator with XRE-family HTH domain
VRTIWQTVDQGNLRELGDFLRARRRTISPGENGSPTTRRRLVPGLSRDETAARADIGTSWYARLEAGRVPQPTLATIRAIARALQLNAVEERFVLELAGLLPPDVGTDRTRDLALPLLALFADDGVASITMYDQFLAPVGWNAIADGGDRYWDASSIIDRNPVMRLAEPRTRAFYGDDYETHARGIVGLFRRAYTNVKDSDYAQHVFARASEMAIFRKYWDEHIVAGEISDPRLPFVRHHEIVGTYAATAIDLVIPNESTRVYIVSPADDESRTKFAELRALGRSSRNPS